jgi:membrane protease YdiL (CAAX protease family)
MNKPIPQTLADAGLKPHHIVILNLFFYFVAAWAWRSAAGAGLIRPSGDIQQLAVMAGSCVLAIVTLSISPDLRKTFGAMFGSSKSRVMLTDIAIAAAVVYSWSIGAHAILVKMPTVFSDPAHFLSFWRFRDSPFQWSAASTMLLAISLCMITPFLEEWIFRGLLLNAWLARRSLPVAIALSSVVFGLFHGDRVVIATGGGVAFALIYLRYQSLWPSIAVHAIYNFTQVLPPVVNLSVVKPAATAMTWQGWIFEIALAIAFVPLAFLFWRRFRPA